MPSLPPAPVAAIAERIIDRYRDVPDVSLAPPGTSMFCRRIRLVNESPTHAAGELEDDCHHFRVDLHHDGTIIERAIGTFMRGPWTTCAKSPEPLRAIEGKPLTARTSEVGRYTDARQNCTHQFDLAALAVAHATRLHERERQYDMAITDMTGEECEQSAALWRNGEVIVRWKLRNRELTAPPEWVGAPLRVKFIPWAESRFEPDYAEAVIALRRVLDIAMSRIGNLDRFDDAASMDGTMMMGRCMTYTDENIPIAIRLKGSARNWEHHREFMLADMHLRGVRREP